MNPTPTFEACNSSQLPTLRLKTEGHLHFLQSQRDSRDHKTLRSMWWRLTFSRPGFYSIGRKEKYPVRRWPVSPRAQRRLDHNHTCQKWTDKNRGAYRRCTQYPAQELFPIWLWTQQIPRRIWDVPASYCWCRNGTNKRHKESREAPNVPSVANHRLLHLLPDCTSQLCKRFSGLKASPFQA